MSKKKRATKAPASVSQKIPRKTREKVLKRVDGRPYLTVALLAVVVLPAIYSVSLSSPTLICHEESILRLPVLSHVRNVPHIISRDFLLFSSGQFRPLSYALLAVLRTLVAPENVLFWHVWLLAFHIINTLLVFAIARHFTPRLAAALVAAAMFGLHPIGTVIVNDINRFYMLIGLTLSLASLKAYLSFSRKGSKTLYSVAIGLFVLAVVTARPAICLGLVLLVYELLYERSGLKRALLRMSPFALVTLSLFPLWAWYTPHPLHYKYVAMHKGSFWHGLFSVTGATGEYAGGLLLTRGIPAVLHDIVEKIYRWSSPKFLVWGALNLMVMVGASLALARKQWAALGILLVFIFMIPFASVAYNRVVDYVSWSYLYFPAAGLALFAGGVYELLMRVPRRRLRAGFQALVLAVFLFIAGRSVQLNLYTRSPLSYWKHVSEIDESSQTALYETGKAYLARGQLPQALHYFFAPMVKDLKYPCLAMARYYCRQGNHLASAIHLRFGSIQKKTGMILEDHCAVAGELLLAVGALDHAEENFGKILMVDPFNIVAMTRLAQVWFLKGFVAEAHRMLKRARAIAPNDKYIARTEEEFRKSERAWQDKPQRLTITPPGPHWLRYVLTQARSPSLRRQIVALSDMADPNDAVIQVEATISLLEDKQYQAAASKAPTVLHCLSGNAYACAVACRAFGLGGNVDRAIQAGRRAVSLDSQSSLAWGSLALAYALQEKPDAASQKFLKAVVQRPASASVFFYNLGLQKRRTGKTNEAAELFEKAIKAQPNNVEALKALGETLLGIGQYQKAGKALQKALAVNPGDAETHANLGEVLLNLGRNAEAAEALSTAIKLDPKSALYHSDLGVALARLSKQEESAREYRLAIELDPHLVNAHYNLANLLAAGGNLSEAAAEYREVIKMMPSHGYAHFSLATVLYKQGKIDEAIRQFQEGIRHNPNSPPAYTALVTLYCEKGEYDLARDVIQRADDLGLKLDPDALTTLRRASPSKKK